jgi:hypothetical protein
MERVFGGWIGKLIEDLIVEVGKILRLPEQGYENAVRL